MTARVKNRKGDNSEDKAPQNDRWASLIGRERPNNRLFDLNTATLLDEIHDNHAVVNS